MPILDAHAFEFFSHSPEQTRRVGMRLGGLLRTGDLVCLQGDLGAGKTTLVQGLARGWGARDSVASPTFVLVNIYRRADGSQLAHFDAYRVESLAEAEELDLETLLAEGPLVVEWPERVDPVLAPARIWIYLDAWGEEQRTLRFTADGPRFETMLDELRQAIYGVSDAAGD
ncbi:MAG: tRNA (adenosine(37)-N6)-threonylcarbamoyltransferase complex ATPase subunit type 1 TsaE [Anaerolineales bacterium]|nr:tRNA (adenosine(37)-N6)-threonylcarbamoyltransferase complex ATPase subunit type 1 TsaE [Anaerolineales bacterium]